MSPSRFFNSRGQDSRIDGQHRRLGIVPDDYAIRTTKLVDDSSRHAAPIRRTSISSAVRWVKGLNRSTSSTRRTTLLDFVRPDLHNDTFELVVDGDDLGGVDLQEGLEARTGGRRLRHADPRISARTCGGRSRRARPELPHFHAARTRLVHGVEFRDVDQGAPVANAAYNYNLSRARREAGIEFWITRSITRPEGPQRAVIRA